MFCTLMRSTSVFAITVALAAPAPVLSQQADGCADGAAPVTVEGSETPVCPEDIVDAQEDTGAEADVAAETETEAELVQEAPADAEAAETDVTEEVVEDVESQTGAEEAPASDDTAETEAAPEETAPEAGEATETAEEMAADSTPEGGATADVTEEETDVAADGDQEPAADAAAADTETGTDTGDAGTAQAGTETEAETAEQAATTETEAETAEQAETEQATEEATDEAAASAEVETEAAEDTAAGEAETAAQSEVVQDDTPESTADANQTVEAEAAQADEGDTAIMETDTVETVTEDTARRSDEEFQSRAQVTEGGDSGLSNFEKFALGALGVAAVATILNRNNEEVVVSSQDRLVVQDDDGYYRVLKNDDALLRRPGVEVATREYSDGSTRTVVTREDGSQVVTIRAADGQVLRRTRILADGRQVVLFDDTRDIEPVDMANLRAVERTQRLDATNEDSLRAALAALENPADRRFSLQQIRQIRAVRELVPEIDLENVNFETGSAVVRPEEASDLRAIGLAIAEAVNANPNEVFLVEGHTDATGGAAMNLALSDRRAESVALALTEYFDIPPENLVVQGYGESNLKVRTQEAERLNRRVAVRKITPLLYARSGN